MAGSYKHCVNDAGEFKGVDLLDDLGDAFEALEEMYGMIWYLAHGFAQQYAGGSDESIENETKDLVEEARQAYNLGLTYSPGVNLR